ncbi:ultrapetala 2-like protein [Tanacetum coccineum]
MYEKTSNLTHANRKIVYSEVKNGGDGSGVRESSLVPVFKPNTGTIFSNEELNEFEVVEVRAPNYIEIKCGCGMKAYIKGKSCCCVVSSPVDFAKHASGTTSIQNWRTKIWVETLDNERIKISDTCLLKCYKGDSYERPCYKTTHGDEFLQCMAKACNKLRRFKLKSQEECRFYHDLAANKNRTCSDMGCENEHCQAKGMPRGLYMLRIVFAAYALDARCAGLKTDCFEAAFHNINNGIPSIFLSSYSIFYIQICIFGKEYDKSLLQH